MNRRTPSPSNDPWPELEATWQAETSPQPAEHAQKIARLGRRQSRIRRLVVISEVLICLLFSSWSVLWLARGTLPEQVAATFILTVIFFAVFVRRRVWFQRRWPDDEPPVERVERLLRHNTEGFRAIRLGQGLLWTEVLFFLIWLPWKQDTLNIDRLIQSYAFLAFWTVLFLVGLWLSKRHLLHERYQFESIQEEIQNGED